MKDWTYQVIYFLGKPGSDRPSKITSEVKKIVDDEMERNDETTAYQLHQRLN